MAFTIPVFPVQQSPYRDLIKDALEAYGTTRYKFPQQEEELKKRQIENQFLPREKEASITAQEQANKFNPQLWGSRLQSEELEREKLKQQLPYIKQGLETDIALKTANTKKAQLESTKMQMLIDELNKKQSSLPESPQVGGQAKESDLPSLTQPSVYGVVTPKPTREDLVNKFLYGIDTFTERQKNALGQQKKEGDQLLQDSVSASLRSEKLNNFLNQYSEYDKLMDDAYLAGGGVGGFLGGHLPSGFVGSRQRIDNLVNSMGGEGIEELKNEMGNARFAVAEFNSAQLRKPRADWNKETRDRYGAFMYATKNRIDEVNQMRQFVLNHPEMGVSRGDLEAIVSTYQNNSPITFREGKKKGDVNWKNLGKWRDYLTPEAIHAIKMGEDYKPKEKVSGKPIVIIRGANGQLEEAS